MVLGASAHQETPFELVVERLAPEHQLERMPLVQALFVLEDLASSGNEPVLPATPGLQITSMSWSGRDEEITPKFDLAVFLQEVGKHFQGVIVYDRDLFERATIERLQRRFVTVLRNALRAPQEQIEHLDLLDEAEKEQQGQAEQRQWQQLRHQSGQRFALPE